MNKAEKQRRVSELPGWAQWYTRHHYIYRWCILSLPFWIGFLLAIAAGVSVWIALIVGSVCFSSVLSLGFKKIPAEPDPHVAILQFFEVRLPVAIGEGYTFTIPIVEELILINASQIEEDLTFTEITCRLHEMRDDTGRIFKIADALISDEWGSNGFHPGGSVAIKIQAIVTPNRGEPWALINLLNRGGPRKALEFLKESVGEDIRQAGRSLTWVQYAFSTDVLSVKLIGDITGCKHTPEETEDVLKNPTEENVRKFLEHVRINGISDIKGSGFIIRALNVVQVAPEGALKKEADRAAIEEVKSLQLHRNVTALRAAMDTLRGDGDGSLNDADVLAAAQAEDGTVKREFREVKITDALQIVKALGDILEKRR